MSVLKRSSALLQDPSQPRLKGIFKSLPAPPTMMPEFSRGLRTVSGSEEIGFTL